MSLKSVTQLLSNENQDQMIADHLELVAEVVKDHERLKASDELKSIVAVGKIEIDKLSNISDEMLGELKSLNSVQKAILRSIERNPLEELEKEREGITGLFPSSSGGGVPSSSPGSSAPTNINLGGPLDWMIRGGLMGGGAAIGSGLFDKGKGIGRKMLGRGLAVGAGLFASNLLSKWIENQTGSSALGDVSKWAGDGASVGFAFGPKGALIGAIANVGVNSVGAVASWIDNKVNEIEKGTMDRLESEYDANVKHKNFKRANEASDRMLQLTARRVELGRVTPEETNRRVEQLNTLKEAYTEAGDTRAAARIATQKHKLETQVKIKNAKEIGISETEEQRKYIIEQLGLRLQHLPEGVDPTKEVKLKILEMIRNPGIKGGVLTAYGKSFEKVRHEIIMNVMEDKAINSKIGRSDLGQSYPTKIDHDTGGRSDLSQSYPMDRIIGRSDLGQSYPMDRIVGRSDLSQSFATLLYDSRKKQNYREEDRYMSGSPMFMHPSVRDLNDVASAVPEGQKNLIIDLMERNDRIRKGEITYRGVANKALSMNNPKEGTTTIIDSSVRNSNNVTTSGRGSSSSPAIAPSVNHNPAFSR